MAGPREIFDCDRVRSYLDSYLEGQVPPPEARAIRLHFQRCQDCWSRVVDRDPLQIFAPLADQEPGESTWDGFWSAVQADIRERGVPPARFLSGLVRPSYAWTAAAALVIIAVVALSRPWLPDQAPARNAGSPPAVESRSVQGDRRDFPDLVVRASGPTLPTVQEVRSPTARVLSMKVYGGDEGVTEVVVIVDPETEL